MMQMMQMKFIIRFIVLLPDVFFREIVIKVRCHLISIC